MIGPGTGERAEQAIERVQLLETGPGWELAQHADRRLVSQVRCTQAG